MDSVMRQFNMAAPTGSMHCPNQSDLCHVILCYLADV